MKYVLLAGFIALVILAGGVSADTITVCQDGSGDATTIQAGIGLASPGDTVCVCPDTYSPSAASPEAFPIVVTSGITITGSTGTPEDVVVDAEGTARVFLCENLDSPVKIFALTVTGGEAGGSVGNLGGGIYCDNARVLVQRCRVIGNHAQGGGGIFSYGPELRVVGCTVTANDAEDHGGGIYPVTDAVIKNCDIHGNSGRTGGGVYCSGSVQTIEGCAIWNNSATDYAGGVRVNYGANTDITGCTIVGNSAPHGGGVAVRASGSVATIENTIIAYNGAGEAFQCDDGGTGSVACCDLFGNAGGDFVDCAYGMEGVDGNFSICPAFCDWPVGDFWVCDSSPCLPGNNTCGILIGAFGQDCVCGPSAVEKTNWGTIKAIYR
jgi:hypothetical protein